MADSDRRNQSRQSGKRAARNANASRKRSGDAGRKGGASAQDESRKSGVIKKGARRSATASTGVRQAVSGKGASKRTTGMHKAVKGGRSSGTTGVQKAVSAKSASSSQRSVRGKKGAKSAKSDRSGHTHGKGGGLKKRGLGLAAKFSIPVCILVAAVITTWGVWVSKNMQHSLMNDIKKNGVTGINFLSRIGEQILSARSRQPAMWPLTLGILTEADLQSEFDNEELRKALQDAIGKRLDEKYPMEYDAPMKNQLKAALETMIQRDIDDLLRLYDRILTEPPPDAVKMKEANPNYDPEMEKTVREILRQSLEFLVKRVNKMVYEGAVLKQVLTVELANEGEVETELLDAFLYDAQKRPIVGARPFEQRRKINIDTRDEDIMVGESEGRLQNIEVYRGSVEEGGARVPCLNFQKTIQVDVKGAPVEASAVLALSAKRIDEQLSSLRAVMIAIGVVAVALAAGVCFYMAWVVTKPVHTLIHDMDIVAQGDLEHQTRAHSSDEIGAIAGQFNEMTQRLQAAQEAERENQRYEDELEMAREIQQKLLPPKIPHIRGLDVHATYHPAKEVGGDYYDLFPIDKEHLGIIVADVSGKGIPGSMVMATTRTVLRFVAARNTSASNTLLRTNQVVAADIRRGMFVTAFYIVLNVRTHEMVVASAGHNPMVLFRGATQEVELVNPSGIALGFDKGPLFERTIKEQTVQLQPGDRVVLYTDGVVEAMDGKNEEYSDERFHAFVKKNTELGSEAFVDALLEDLDRHKGNAEQHDDITVVAFGSA